MIIVFFIEQLTDSGDRGRSTINAVLLVAKDTKLGAGNVMHQPHPTEENIAQVTKKRRLNVILKHTAQVSISLNKIKFIKVKIIKP